MFGDLHDLVVFLSITIGILVTIWNAKLQMRNQILNDECNKLALKKHDADMSLRRYKQDVSAEISNYLEAIKKIHGGA